MRKWQFFGILALVAVVGMFWTRGWAEIRKSQQQEASRQVVERSRQLGRFNSIEVSTAIGLVYTQGQGQSVSVKTEEWMQPFVVAEVEADGTLNLYIDDKWKKQHVVSNYNQPTVRVMVQSPQLKEAEISGACSFEVAGNFTQSSPLEIETDGASSFKAGDIAVPTLSLEASGASSINVNNFVGRLLEVETAGASTCKIISIKADRAEVESSGASTINITSGWAADVDAEANGASSVKMRGVKARNVEKSSIGASSCKVGK